MLHGTRLPAIRYAATLLGEVTKTKTVNYGWRMAMRWGKYKYKGKLKLITALAANLPMLKLE